VFDNVFVGVDGRSGGREAIALAKQLVQPGGQLTLAHVYRTHRVLGRAAALLQPAEREASLELLGREREAASVQAKLVIDAASTVGLGLRQLAARHRADLLVVGSCHRGAPGRLFLGDDTRATLNGAPCPMAIAPGGYQPHELSDIGIGYDASPESHEALGAARELAARHGSTIRALSVVSLQSIPYGEPIPIGWPKFANGLVDDELKRSAQNEGVIGDATPGRPTKDLAEFANEVDLLIVGSRGYGPLGRLLNGSTSNYLARHACCPLLVLPRARPCNGRPGATSSEQDRGSNLLISRSDSLADTKPTSADVEEIESTQRLLRLTGGLAGRGNVAGRARWAPTRKARTRGSGSPTAAQPGSPRRVSRARPRRPRTPVGPPLTAGPFRLDGNEGPLTRTFIVASQLSVVDEPFPGGSVFAPTLSRGGTRVDKSAVVGVGGCCPGAADHDRVDRRGDSTDGADARDRTGDRQSWSGVGWR